MIACAKNIYMDSSFGHTSSFTTPKKSPDGLSFNNFNDNLAAFVRESPDSIASIHKEVSPTRFFSFPKMTRNCINSRRSIGSDWSATMQTLRQSNSSSEAIGSLLQLRSLLRSIDRSDRLKFCKTDFDAGILILRKNKHVWIADVSIEISRINNDYFNQSLFRILPTIIIQEIMKWLPISEIYPIVCTCKEWRFLGCEDIVWRDFYVYKYMRINPNTYPVELTGFMESFHRRFLDPQIGDGVEVSWQGKFRLESTDVYHGLAWWVAIIVDKHPSQNKYKIHYPGWDARWDEWVIRSRLRWSVDRNIVEAIKVNDTVELWCCGAFVPGAWLESKVKKIRGDRYCLGRVLSGGNLWVERDRIRLLRRAIDDNDQITERQRLNPISSQFNNGTSDVNCCVM